MTSGSGPLLNAPPAELEESLFHSARAALKFALSVEGRPARPLMATMADKSFDGDGLQLSGLDRAGQAGLILGVMGRLTKLNQTTLIASAAPPSFRCLCQRACCSGRRINFEWRDAVSELASVSAEQALCRAPYQLRRAIIIKIYSVSRINLVDIAHELGIDQHTAGKHHRTINQWLMGVRGSAGREPIKGLDAIAWEEAEQALRDARVVG